NPFQDRFSINLRLDRPLAVGVNLFDGLGRLVVSVPERMLGGGRQTLEVKLDSARVSSLPAGVYFCHVKLGERMERVKVIKR
ncbi:MAG: T9SS type A sorting domain-containing protein, partial [Bacteroidota bacterium]